MGRARFLAQADVSTSQVKADPFAASCHDVDGGRIFALRGELDAATCRGLAEHLIGPPGSLIVLDLCQLTFIDSSGLGAIHMARRAAIENGGTLVVCRPSPMVYRVLEITGLDEWVADWNPEWSKGSAVGP
jgi:anti-sigma B factor antagonist